MNSWIPFSLKNCLKIVGGIAPYKTLFKNYLCVKDTNDATYSHPPLTCVNMAYIQTVKFIVENGSP